MALAFLLSDAAPSVDQYRCHAKRSPKIHDARLTADVRRFTDHHNLGLSASYIAWRWQDDAVRQALPALLVAPRRAPKSSRACDWHELEVS